MKNKVIIQITLLTIVLIMPALLHAQPSFTDDVVDAPVDGGLSLLVAAGIGYGAKRVRAGRKKTSMITEK